MTRWLITGATGLLGSNAALLLGATDDVVCSARTRPPRLEAPFFPADLARRDRRAGLVERSAAEVVLHAGALATLEACEADPALAQEVNVAASADLAAQAARTGARFVFISTDAVFDGTRGGYREDDQPSPQSEYGRTKRRAEQAVLDVNPQAIVARVNFFGWSPSGRRGLAEFFVDRLARGQKAPGFTDVTVSTSYLADTIAALTSLQDAGQSGLFHVASSEPTTKFDFGRELARTFGWDTALVTPASSSDHLTVKRGKNLSLDTSRLAAVLKHPLPGRTAGLQGLHAAEQAGMRDRLRIFDPGLGE